MSPSTGGHDATTKWEAYQRIGSLTDYLLVDQSRARIERYSRTGAEAWSYAAYGPGQHVPLSHGTTLEIDAIYAGAFELGTEAAQSG